MKKNIKKIIYKNIAKDINSLYKMVENAEIISFDIFDTLIKRNLSQPQDIFYLVEYKFNIENATSKSFFKERINAENRARRKRNDREINIDEIYDELQGFNEYERKRLKALEFEMELAICCPYMPMKKIFDWCIKKGKKVILISDMYLPLKQIKKILSKCGYSLPENIFISCEERCNKKSGKIYKVISNKLVKNTGEWFHIGDSIIGDYLKPKLFGIHSILINKEIDSPYYFRCNIKNLTYEEKIFYGFIKAYLENHENENLDDFAKIGYEILGPIIYYFSIWLHSKIKDKKYNKILFLARDSKILKEAYELLFPETLNDNEYFYISRKAVSTAVVDLLNNYTEMHDLFVPKDSARFEELCNILKIDNDKLNNLEEKFNITKETLINSKDSFDKELLFLELKENSKLESLEQRNLLLNYIEKVGIKNSFAIVDIGWEGRTEWALERICNVKSKKIRIDGYYLGIITKCPELIKKINVFSFWGELKNTDKDARIIMESIALFETMFLTSEGSTIGYKKDKNGNILPVKAEVDQVEYNRKKIDEMQKHAIAFVKDMCNDGTYQVNIPMNPHVLLNVYADFSIRPTYKTVRLLKELQFRDNGLHEMGAKHNLLYYCIHPCIFNNALWKSYYRVLFLKDIFKIPFPYFESLYIFYKWNHRKKNFGREKK